MSKPPLDRYTAAITLTIDISAPDEKEAYDRLVAAEEFINQKLARSTFTRMRGMPALYHSEIGDVTYT